MICAFPYQRKNALGHWESFPCGRCAPCRVAKAAEWSVRMVHESEEFPGSAFLTLTYESDEQLSLDKSHLQKFFKRLRKSGVELKYYACGEYGGATFRPHYHVCIFYSGDLGFRSDPTLGRSNGRMAAWPFGLVNFGVFSASSARYTADYLLKAVGVEYPAFLESPFRLVSTGLGKRFFERNRVQIEKFGVTLNGVHKPVSRYYKDRFSEEAKLELKREALSREDSWTLAKGIQADKNVRARQALFRTED